MFLVYMMPTTGLRDHFHVSLSVQEQRLGSYSPDYKLL